MRFFNKIFLRETLLSRHGFLVFLFIITLSVISLSYFIYSESEAEFKRSKATYQRDMQQQAVLAAERISDAFGDIYQNIRTISRLPSVRLIDRYAQNLSGNDYIAIQEIYKNLAGNVAVSAVYIISADFDPEHFDQVINKKEEPIIVFDDLMAGRALNSEKPQKGKKISPASEEIEIYQYRMMREQIDWLKAHYPTADKIINNDFPVVSGREIITSDNSRFSPSAPNDADRSGSVFSIPFYDMHGKFKGVVSAVILTDAIRDIIPDSNYALVNNNYKQIILSKNPSQELQQAREWIEKESKDPNLIYSDILPLHVKESSGDWKLWVGIPDKNFYADERNTEILDFRNFGCASVVLFGGLGIIWLFMFRANTIQMEKNLILARDNAEAESQRKSTLLSNIINNAVDGLITIDEKGIVQTFNPAAESIFGYTSGEVIGKNINILMPEPYHSEHDQYISNYTRTGRSKIIGIGREVNGKRKNGELFLLDLAISVITLENGQRLFSGIIRDITQRKMVEEKLKESQSRFQLAIIGSNNGIWDWDIITDKAYFSPQFKKMLGYDDFEIGDSFTEWTERIHPDEKEAVLELLQKHLMERQGPYDVEYHLKLKSGEYRWFRSKGQAIWSEDGKPLRIAGSLSDISKRKQAEQQLKEYTKKMEEANKQLDVLQQEAEDMNFELVLANEKAQIEKMKADEATKLKSEFLANMSHEIRTPMNGIIGMTNLLLDCDLKPAERGYAKIVMNSAEALLQIINDILDFSKIEAGKIELEMIPFDLQNICQEVCEMMAVKANEKEIELLLRYPQETPRFCIGDPSRVRQILFNLINNAIKFTDNGHVVVSLSSEKIGNEKLKFHVEIEDTGIGIPTDKIDLIFNKFSQADQSTARKFGGTGLGLSICKELTSMMYGDIGVNSTYGVGSIFWFDIVLAEDKSGVNNIEVPTENILQGVRVLVVDDVEAVRVSVRDQMTPYGVEVVERSSGNAALELLEKDPDFDIGIFDSLMPQMSGIDLAEKIKANDRTKNISLLMITSTPNRGDRKNMEQIGFSGYLTKPLAHGCLRDAISVITQARRSGDKLPMITQHNLKEAKIGAKPKDNEALQFTNLNILLAEDNQTNRTVATIILEKYGCSVTAVSDGEEAIKKLKQRNFDMVFMDCQMPVMDGYEATQIIRKLEAHQKRGHTPIIAFTANAMKGDDDKCLNAGMDDYIPKPLRKADLERVLVEWGPKEKRIANMVKGGKIVNDTSVTKDIAIIEMSVFSSFQNLMGDNLESILTQHFQVAENYVKTINSALAEGNYRAMVEAAHPLKSSSQQIGAMKVASIAKEIEYLANLTNPNIKNLKSLAKQVEKAQQEVVEFISSYIKGEAA